MRAKIPLLLLLLCVAARADDKLAGGPYVVHVGPKSATIAYVVQTSEVRVEGGGTSPVSIPVLRREQVSLTGLKPGTVYQYDVLGRDEGKGSFRTAPLPGHGFEFVVFGDTRVRHDVHQRVVNAVLANAHPELLIHTGDLINDGADTALWPIFFGIEKELLRKVAFVPVLGNHERNNLQYHQFFDVAEGYYSFDWGAAHFVILNSDLANTSASSSAREAYWTEQVRWLEEDLGKAQKADFRFIACHHPPFTAVKKRQGDNAEMKALVPLFEKYKVNAVFNGHDHNYQHHLKDGVQYVTTGGGGAPLHEVDAPIDGVTLKAESVENFVQVVVDGKVAHVVARAVDGRILDKFDIQ